MQNIRRLNDVTGYETASGYSQVGIVVSIYIVEKTVPGKVHAQLALAEANHWFIQLHGDE